MDVKIEEKSETKKEIKVTIFPEEMEKFVKKAAEEFSKKMNIKGFRPGNAPKEIVENTVGKEKLYEEAAKEAVEETYPEIVKENNLFTLANPHVEIIKCAPGNEVIYKAVVYIMPEIKLPNYQKIAKETAKKEKKEVKVEDEEIEKAIENVRESRAKKEKKDGPAEKGDFVRINFNGIFEGIDDKKIDEKNFEVTLGNGDLDILPGFEDSILGMRAGEKKSFSIKTPDVKNVPEKEENTKGRKINFNVEMVTVEKKEIPELDDDFSQSFPNIKNLKELKEKIKEGILREKEAKEKERVRIKILEAIKKVTSFGVPEVMVEKEIDNMVQTVKNQLAQNNTSFDKYLKEIKKTEEELRKEWWKKAEENVSYALILHAVSKEENIEVTDEEIEKEIKKHFNFMGKKKEEEKEENLQRMRAYVHDVIKNRKVFQVLSIEE